MTQPSVASPTSTNPTSSRPSYAVNPYRFTDRPRAVTEFLQAVGLQLVTGRDDFAVLRGSGGYVAVHPLDTAESTRAVSTSLCLVTEDARVAAETLTADGVGARWWDEAFGRQAAAAGPHGEITVNDAGDPHGYRQYPSDEQSGDRPDLSVTAVYSTPDPDAAAAFFAHVGFHGDETLDGWRPLRGAPGAGAIGLHAADTVPEPGDRCALEFETSEPLDAFAARLRGLGYEVADERDADAPHVTLTDPDGERVEVHALAR